MKKRNVTYILGGILILAVVSVILFKPLPILFYPGLPFEGFLKRAFYILLLSFALCLYRIVRGPTAADRAVTLDILGVLIVGFCVITGISTGRSWYIDIAIAWVLQSFIATLALAKFLEGKSLND
ncbi:MAG: cation:proton antiporter [Candidatus Omnitrophica bacterium]|nr:cation:proton antiporter [Candidatus Omnitrophota bacterium]